MKRTLFATILILALFGLSGWISRPGASAATDVEQGKQVFQQNCLQCHSATSTAPKVGPGLKGLFKNEKLPASGKPATEANVRKQILEGGGGMPGFERSLEKAQVDALIEYLKTL